MVYKTKVTETWEVTYEDQIWVLNMENELDTGEIYYSVFDFDGNEVEEEELFNEIVTYWERSTGQVSEPRFDERIDSWDPYDDWDNSYI